MVVLFFIIVLEVSFAVHILYLIKYIAKKDPKAFNGFVSTFIINIAIGIFVSIFVMLYPSQIREINFNRFLFLESGFIFSITVYVKVKIAVKIYRKTKDPAHYHISYFGKKVIHPSVIAFTDLIVYFLTLPVTLICGAYFVTRLLK
jgi:hypothetical protein